MDTVHILCDMPNVELVLKLKIWENAIHQCIRLSSSCLLNHFFSVQVTDSICFRIHVHGVKLKAFVVN